MRLSPTRASRPWNFQYNRSLRPFTIGYSSLSALCKAPNSKARILFLILALPSAGGGDNNLVASHREKIRAAQQRRRIQGVTFKLHLPLPASSFSTRTAAIPCYLSGFGHCVPKRSRFEATHSSCVKAEH